MYRERSEPDIYNQRVKTLFDIVQNRDEDDLFATAYVMVKYKCCFRPAG